MIQKLKTGLGKMMNFVMLSCEDATLLMTRKSAGRISLIESIQLKMHLLSCNMCRIFKIQNELIDSEIEKFNAKDIQLSNTCKITIEEKIKEELSNS